MKTKVRILILVFILAGWCAKAQIGAKSELTLFADRAFCVSGDTVWLKIKLPPFCDNREVVRIQFDNHAGLFICDAALQSKHGWAEGFLTIPDSLSTGQYFITAWMLGNQSEIQVAVSKSLLVYNRFDENISEIKLTPGTENTEKITSDLLKIKTRGETWRTRDVVEVEIERPASLEIADAVVKATLVDPLGNLIRDRQFSFQPVILPEKGFNEAGGVLLRGKVTDADSVGQPGVLVVITLSDRINYFDYFITDINGLFNFFVKNVTGNAEIIIQVFSAIGKKFNVTMLNHKLVRNESVFMQSQILTVGQAAFAHTAIESSFAQRLFNPSLPMLPDSLQMPEIKPFYGKPTLRVIPDEFIDLSDFREISRELLLGLQYRVTNGEIVLRMLNRNRDAFFSEEPLRLINGIPVFDNRLLARLKSTDISYIDMVQTGRIYGDIVMNGILNVKLYNNSNHWLDGQPNVFRFNTVFLQPAKTPSYLEKNNFDLNEPDMRQVFTWQQVAGNPSGFSFELSDRKGKVEISIEGYTNKGIFFKSTKIIEVK